MVMTLPPAYGTRVDLSWVFLCRHQLFRGHQPIKLENFEAQSLESDARLPNIHTFDAKDSWRLVHNVSNGHSSPCVVGCLQIPGGFL